MIKTYSELSKLKTFDDRFDYLKLGGAVGECTFASQRYLNQKFYQSKEWKQLRNNIVIRDRGCDLGVPGYDLQKADIIIHHLNPVTVDDLLNGNYGALMDPENLVCVSKNTHNAIHYSGEIPDCIKWQPRKDGDTCLWR